VPKTEGQRSWDIRGSNDRLNRVFELNRLPYGGYPGLDDVDRRGKKPVVETGDDPVPAAAPSSKNRKLGTCWGLVLKCYELRTRQHKMLVVKYLRPSEHYLP
jgi:hypothetical protein